MKKRTIGNCVLYHGDCFDILPKLDCRADAVISDPPFGITACDWDILIPLARFWDMVDRKTKPTANFVLFGCGRFSVDLINSKYRWYRYDLIWHKNNKVGFLNANLMPHAKRVPKRLIKRRQNKRGANGLRNSTPKNH
jgi:site-specific DNA-methyltransferase (adenine-specific)